MQTYVNPQTAPETAVYRVVDGIELTAHIFRPEQAAAPSAGIAFFHGGGWRAGHPKQFFPHCNLLASLGMLAVTFQYRLKSVNDTTPYDAVEDAQAAMRWLRANAQQFNLDPDRLASGGGSAGGHLSLAVALTPELAPEPDMPSCRPSAVCAFNPVADTGPEGYGGKALLGDRALDISPLHHVKPGSPPMIIFHGEADTTVPITTIYRFRDAMTAAGNTCEVVSYPDMPHAFFNYGKYDGVPFHSTVQHMVRFLTEHGFIEA